jgi:hypothetical protein
MTEKVLILSIVSYKMQEIHITEKYMTVHFTGLYMHFNKTWRG